MVDLEGHRARDVANLPWEFFGDEEIAGLIVSGNGHVDGRGRAKVQNLRDDVRGLKEKLHAGKSLRKLFAKRGDVGAGGFAALFLQLHEDFAVGGAEGSGVAVAEIDAAIGHAEIVQHRLQLFGGNGFADYAVDLIGEARGFFNAQTVHAPEVQAELARVPPWQKASPNTENT